ncbi:MAG TPA: hypothetical protein VJP86_18195 [Vicinamibacterales bacterium]|jgi:hypothetical protein|nr:hypothetical protein [Vicinamibacterales bacterium]
MKRSAAATLAIFCALMLHGDAQSNNQAIYLQYDGFIRDAATKTITYSFGYWNLNHEDITIEPGPENGFLPPPADRQQPTVLTPGRHRFACTIVMPDDFKGDLKWQVRFGGKTFSTTEKVTNPLYELELSSARRAMAGMDLKTAPRNVCANHAPTISVGAAGGGGGGDAAGVPDVGDDSGPAVAPTPQLSVNQDAELNLPGNVSDDELPRGRTIAISWKKTSGPGNVTFTSLNTAASRARFSAPGAYELMLSATDGERSTDQPVKVTVNPVGYTTSTEKAPPTYSQAMKDIQASQTGLRTSIGSKNYDAVAQNIAKLQAAFSVTRDFWTDKQKQDAVTASNNALKAIADLDAAVKAKDDPKLITAQTALGRTCASCHAAHRQSVGGGAFEIK